MKKQTYYIIGILLLSHAILFNGSIGVVKADALAISYPILPDGVIVDLSASNIFESDDFYYNLRNTGNVTLNVTAEAEALFFENWEQNFTISFNQPYKILHPNESFKFIPKIIFNIDLTFNYSIHFIFRGLQAGVNGTVNVVIAKGSTAKFRVFTELTGYSLRIRTTDQGDWERRSNIKIWYGGNEEKGRAYTIFKELENTASFSSIVLAGWYQITARMYDNTSDAITEYVRLNQSRDIRIIYQLVSIELFLELPATYTDDLNFSYKVENNYVELRNVTLVFQVFKTQTNGTLFAVTDPIIHPIEVFPKGSLTSAQLSFSGGWISGDHIFSAKIYVINEVYFERNDEITFSFPLIDEIQRSDYFPLLIIFITFGVTMIGQILLKKLYLRYKEKNKLTLEKRSIVESNETISVD